MQATVFSPRNELRIFGADGVKVRREQDCLADFVSRPQARDQIGAPGQHFLKFDFDPARVATDARKSATRCSPAINRVCRAEVPICGTKPGLTLGSAMSSAKSFSVRVMRQKFNGREHSCRGPGRKAQRALSNIQITKTTCIQRPPLKLKLPCQFNPVGHFGK